MASKARERGGTTNLSWTACKSILDPFTGSEWACLTCRLTPRLSWCRRWDSNPHEQARKILSLLPIPFGYSCKYLLKRHFLISYLIRFIFLLFRKLYKIYIIRINNSFTLKPFSTPFNKLS